MKIKALSWNAQSIQGKIPEIKRFLNTNLVHVILIQETWLNPNVTFNIPNYTCVRNDRPSNSRYPHGGVAILVHFSIQFKVINFCKLSSTEAVFIQMKINNRDTIIGSVYCSSSLTLAEYKKDVEKLITKPGPFILAGDWNAKHRDWNNPVSNGKGIFLSKLAHNHLCKIISTDSPTTFPAVGDPSFLDFVIAKGTPSVVEAFSINELSSDHIPVVFEIFSNVDMPRKAKVSNYKKASWKLFRQVVADECKKLDTESLDTRDEIDKNIQIFNEILHQASEKAIPLKTPFVFRYPFSQTLKDLTRKRNAIRNSIKKFPRLKPEVNKLNRLIRREIETLNRESFNDKLSKLNVEDLSLFKFAKIIKKKAKPIPPLASANGELLFASKEKADLIASNFLKSHQISPVDTVHTRDVGESISLLSRTPTDLTTISKIRQNETKDLIERMKLNKAPGFDNVSNRLIKSIPDIAISTLNNIFNSCLRQEYFPPYWKQAKVIAIPKPEKNLSLPASYRPISLLPVIGKLFEKLILYRLQDFELDNNILINQQFGFRAKHSTSHQVLRLTKAISVRFNEDKSTALATLDIEKAFDSVWHEALIHKLRIYKCPTYLIKIVSSFLRDRKAFVSVANAKSEDYNIPAGVPQGSCLSPFLFNYFINDIPIPNKCKIAIYADDTALLSSIKNYDLPKLVSTMESGLSEIQDYFQSWKVKINDSKTNTILFSHSKIMKNLMNSHKIKFNGATLKWEEAVRYLGVWLDPKLSFATHVSKSLEKARKAVSVLYCLLKKNNRVSVQSKLTIYRSYIRPIFTYACPVIANCPKYLKQKMQIQQNKCLRMALNAPFRTRIKTLHEISNIPLVSEYIKKLTDNFYKQSERVDNNLINRLGSYSPCTSKVKHRLPKPT